MKIPFIRCLFLFCCFPWWGDRFGGCIFKSNIFQLIQLPSWNFVKIIYAPEFQVTILLLVFVNNLFIYLSAHWNYKNILRWSTKWNCWVESEVAESHFRKRKMRCKIRIPIQNVIKVKMNLNMQMTLIKPQFACYLLAQT